MAQISINEIPMSDNYFKGRLNVQEYRREKQRWTNMVHWLCVAERVPKMQGRCRVRLTYHFKDRGRRDPDNYSGKFILDGLVEAGVLKDDSFKHIKLELDAVFGAKKAMTIIDIEELEEPNE